MKSYMRNSAEASVLIVFSVMLLFTSQIEAKEVIPEDMKWNQSSYKEVTQALKNRNSTTWGGTGRDEVVHGKVLRVAMGDNLPPMHYADEDGELVGFEVDLVHMFASEIGMKIEIINPYKIGKTSLSLLLDGGG